MDASRARGFTLIELVIFIVLVGIAFGGLMLAISQFTKTSADPLIDKQALAIAESLLDEIELMPFTTCDPDDANAATGVGCTTLESIGPEGGQGEDRWSSTSPFDNVNDYHGFQMLTGIKPIYDATTAITGLGNYKASVTVAAANLGGITSGSGNVLRITVTVTKPDNTTISLDGFRARYAPTTAQ